MSPTSLDPVKRDQVIARLRQGDTVKDIAAKLGLGLSTVYRIANDEGVGEIDSRMGRRKNTLTLPPTLATSRTVNLALTDDELAAITKNPRLEGALVAASIQTDSLRTRMLRAIGSDGPFKNTEELANTIRRKTDNFGYHEMTTILKHCKKQGLVSLKENKRATPGATDSHPTNIDLTLRGREQLGLKSRPIAERVLELLCRDNGSSSNVRLAADLWEGPNDNATVLRVDAALELLNGLGQCIYKLGPNGTLNDIKPTNKGYEAAGIPVPGKSQESARGGRTPGTGRAGHAVGKDFTEKRNHLPWASGSEIIREPLNPDHRALFPGHTHDDVEPTASAPQIRAEPIPTPGLSPVTQSGKYPLLESLRASFAVRAAADAKASALADAAALLEKVDPVESERLMNRALAESPESLSPVEKEFLQYAEEHP